MGIARAVEERRARVLKSIFEVINEGGEDCMEGGYWCLYRQV